MIETLWRIDFTDGTVSFVNEETFTTLKADLAEAADKQADYLIEFDTLSGARIISRTNKVVALCITTEESRAKERAFTKQVNAEEEPSWE